MTIPEVFIQARKAGWDGVENESAFLQKSFWRAYGESIGWEEICLVCGYTRHDTHCLKCGTFWVEEIEDKQQEWLKQWHNFVTFLSVEGSIEGFFQLFSCK